MFAARRACIDNFFKLRTFTMRKHFSISSSNATFSSQEKPPSKSNENMPKKISFNEQEYTKRSDISSGGLFSEILDDANSFKMDCISTPSLINGGVSGTRCSPVSCSSFTIEFEVTFLCTKTIPLIAWNLWHVFLR